GRIAHVEVHGGEREPGGPRNGQMKRVRRAQAAMAHHQIAGVPEALAGDFEDHLARYPAVKGPFGGRPFLLRERAQPQLVGQCRGELGQGPVTDGNQRVVGSPAPRALGMIITDEERHNDACVEIVAQYRYPRRISATAAAALIGPPAGSTRFASSHSRSRGIPVTRGDSGSRRAIALPRRVITTSSPASMRSSSRGKLFLASATE